MPWEVACDRNWLNVEKSRLIAGEKSAEGIVVPQMRGEGPNGRGEDPPGRDKPGIASVKAERCYPRGQGMKPDWHTG